MTLHNLKQKNKGKVVVYITNGHHKNFFVMGFKILGSVDLWMSPGTFLPPPQGRVMGTSGHFTVVCLVTWPWIGSEAEVTLF